MRPLVAFRARTFGYTAPVTEQTYIDHPYIADPQYSTTAISWYDGGLHFFRRVPEDGIALLNVYHAAYLIIFLVAIWWCHRWWRQGTFRIRKRLVFDSILVAVISIVIGGRLGEAIFYQPEYFFSQPSRLVTNAGGFTIHGIVIGVIVGFRVWAWWIKRPWFHMLDQAVIFVAFGTPLGRIANFLGGELWGRETDLPWGVRFPMRGPLMREVVQNGKGETFVVVDTPQPDETVLEHLEPWQLDQGAMVLEGAPLRVIPVGSPDASVFEAVREMVTTPRHPSQLYQAVMEGLILLVILLVVRGKAKFVGQLSAWFLVCYGGLRMLSEFFRNPEPGLGYLLGLTRGQLLSLSMVAGGAILFVWVYRRKQRIDSIATDAPGFEPQIDAKPAAANP